MAQLPIKSLRWDGVLYPGGTTPIRRGAALERRPGVLSPIVLLTPIVLKLTGVITWSWWWVVLAPAWISAALLALLVTGLVILFPGHAKPWSASEAGPRMPPEGTSG